MFARQFTLEYLFMVVCLLLTTGKAIQVIDSSRFTAFLFAVQK
jgi:hypothetical protein